MIHKGIRGSKLYGLGGNPHDLEKIEVFRINIWQKSSVSKVDSCGACGEQVGCNSI